MTTPLNDALSRFNLTSPPVAVAFLQAPPPGLKRVDRAAPAGCEYWKHAAAGHAFYTSAEDHHNCPVGAFTHGAELSPEKGRELESLVGTMTQLQYLKSEEVPQIPHRTQPLRFAAYAPLATATFSPDVVIFRGNARQIMLLSEAARAAGAFDTGTAMGRPACAMLPHALDTGAGVASIGCIGNRVYTQLADDELYLAVPAKMIQPTLEKLDTIVTANVELEKFHRERAATLGG
jgi:uncharacterized protein (DUF169 family)